MTSATDILRRLLDERGVEYSGGYDITEWDVDGTHYLATEPLRLDGRVVLRRTCTPAQAIDATLGRGTCRIGRGTSGLMHVTTGHCSECGAEVVKPAHYCPNCGRKVVA